MSHRFSSLIFLLFSVINGAALAEGFSFLSDQSKLVEQMIVATGNPTKINFSQKTVNSGSFRSISGYVYSLGAYCFDSSESLTDSATLLLISQHGNLSTAVLSNSIGSINIKYTPALLVNCQEAYAQMQGSSAAEIQAMQEQIEAMRKRNQDTMEMIRKMQSMLRKQ